MGASVKPTKIWLLKGLAGCLLCFGCSGQKQASHEASDIKEETPAVYSANFETSKGNFVIEVTRDWAPNGADRFYELVKRGFYDGARFFRVLHFMAQFGISGDPAVMRLWQDLKIPDDPVKQSNRRSLVSFAMAGPNSRTTQIFINLTDNARLDKMNFAPFGKVTQGMEVVDSLYNGYGEGAPRGNGPQQDLIRAQGNAYLESKFPRLDYIKKASIQK
jgi:peptidyl-prolyl cis-trans isomerase A (cyclophilin A)